MHFNSLLCTTLAVASLGAFANNAPVTNENGPDFYKAELGDNDSGLTGQLSFGPGPNGKGVSVHLNFGGYKNGSETFLYHIHKNPIASSGDCSSAGGHLDPFQGTESCDASHPEACQVGDLSGKHGTLSQQNATQDYGDYYLSVNKNDKAFVGEKSLVIHDMAKNPIACTNITKFAGADDPVQAEKLAAARKLAAQKAKVPVKLIS